MKINSADTKQQTRKKYRSSGAPNMTELEKIYSETDYNSNDGMLTSVWGPGMWHYLHTMSFNYPVHPTKRDKQHYRSFMLSLRHVLPCGKCRANLRTNFKKLPLTMTRMKNRAAFSRYVFELHELINEMLNKKSGLTYEVVRERYEHFRARCTLSLKSNKTKKHVRFAKTLNIATESGCTDPLYGEKSKCILQIVPQHTKQESLSIDKECIKQKSSVKTALAKTDLVK